MVWSPGVGGNPFHAGFPSGREGVGVGLVWFGFGLGRIIGPLSAMSFYSLMVVIFFKQHFSYRVRPGGGRGGVGRDCLESFISVAR